MRLANSHKAYLGVLAVALGALAVDSFFLKGEATGPAAASAAPTPSATASAPATAPAQPEPNAAPAAPAPVAKAAEPTHPKAPRLATRLDSLKDAVGPAQPGLLFAGAEEWLNPPEKPAAVDADPASTSTTAAEPSHPHLPKHELTSVLVAGDRSCVILDGQTLRIGDEHAGLRLISVEPGATSAEQGAATFEWNGQMVRLVVQAK